MTQSRLVSANVRRYGLAVFIGRFSPPHLGHLAVILQALLTADLVLIAIGSANAPRRHDYVPFTAAERETMIRLMLTPEQNARVRFVHVEDQGDMPTWSSDIRRAANKIVSDNKKITLIGHSKDHSSYYLKGFPGWASTDVGNYMGLSATTYRKPFFERDYDAANLITDALHPEVQIWLRDFMETIDYAMLVEEAAKCAKDINDYGRIDPETGKKVYGPYLAADAVFIQGDHVLVIERGGHPYKGCIAIAGGFVHDDEDVVEAAIREGAKEETGLKVPELVIRKAYVGTEWFSAPHRDPRGRVISAASLFYFDPQPPASMVDPKEIAKYLALPRVKAGDDAARAFWMPISELKRENMAFDHYIMIQRMLKLLDRNAR
jgi:bifunctional NMN adenylyltransferase/nudix hydrolase